MFHRDNSVFDAASSCSLSSDCPPGSVLVGQAVLDNGVHGLEPSILIFDIRGHGTASTSEMSAEKRYALLRQEGAKYFRNTRVSIQWVGHGSAAQKFILSGALPHKAECVFSIPHSTEPYVMKVYENEGSDKRSPAIAPP